MPRTAKISRQTKETKVKISLDLDGSGKTVAETGVGFFDHMLDLLGRHSLIDLSIEAQGDLKVDAHHTVEDVGIVLGQTLEKALGEKRGIQRLRLGYRPNGRNPRPGRHRPLRPPGVCL